jgi:hypothetical protein
MGGATVGLTYLLSREIARSLGIIPSRASGVAAALMIGFAGVHILVNSHIAWSNSVTPFYTTLGLWLVLRVVRTQQPRLLALAGVCFGLALQTHLLAGMFIPAVAVYVVWKGRWLLRNRWTAIGVLLFVLSYSNVIVYNIVNAGDTVRHAQYIRTRHNYLTEGSLPETDSMVVVRNAGRTVWMLGETLVSSVGPSDDWPEPLDPAIVVLGLAVTATALGRVSRATASTSRRARHGGNPPGGESRTLHNDHRWALR